jgi:hypothetical protein
MKARRIRVDGEGAGQQVTMQESDGTEPDVIRSEYDEEVTES